MPRMRASARPKRPDAARNARPKVKFIVRDVRGALLRDPLDGRSVMARLYRERLAAMRAHLGNVLTAAQEALVAQEARLALAEGMAWAQIVAEGAVVNGKAATAAFETFTKAGRERRAVLQILGLERAERGIVDVAAEVARQQDEERRLDGR